jgi:hypothetical protein
MWKQACAKKRHPRSRVSVGNLRRRDFELLLANEAVMGVDCQLDVMMCLANFMRGLDTVARREMLLGGLGRMQSLMQLVVVMVVRRRDNSPGNSRTGLAQLVGLVMMNRRFDVANSGRDMLARLAIIFPRGGGVGMGQFVGGLVEAIEVMSGLGRGNGIRDGEKCRDWRSESDQHRRGVEASE